MIIRLTTIEDFDVLIDTRTFHNAVRDPSKNYTEYMYTDASGDTVHHMLKVKNTVDDIQAQMVG